MILTNTELQAWAHCKRCWYLGFYRCLRKRDDVRSPLTIGSLYHKALQEYYTVGEGRGPHPVDAIQKRAITMALENEVFVDEIARDAEMAGIMAEGYMEWLEETGEDADLEIYAAETKLEVPLGETGHIIRGKLDARAIRRSSSAKLFMEHKTVGNLVELPKTAQTNPQFLTYSLLEYLELRESGQGEERTDGLLLNMAKKVKRTPRAKPPFYARLEVRYNLAEIRNHWRHVVTAAAEIQSARDRLDAGENFQYVVPPNSTRECFWRDGFASLCVTGMMDNGADFEGYITENFETWDPLSRYEEDEETA